jgi:SAM-dependent methyltransferase
VSKEAKIMTAERNVPPGVDFLDMQARVGVTKHVGGIEATDELLSLCHIEDAREVLNVGCGIGVGPAYIAKKYDCRVVGVDISEKMVEWSRRRAKAERVETKVEFRTADVLDLPFDADRFDVVFCESVLAFVEDKPRAIGECVRVTRPGGYVGLNETYWIKEPSPEMVARVRASVCISRTRRPGSSSGRCSVRRRLKRCNISDTGCSSARSSSVDSDDRGASAVGVLIFIFTHQPLLCDVIS